MARESELDKSEAVDLEEYANNLINDIKPEEIEIEQGNKPKVSFSEKKAISAQNKLIALREKMSSNPPKTIIGKKLAVARLNRLSNIVDRKILKNNIKALSKSQEYKNYDIYYTAQQKLMSEISNLNFEKENILRQIRKIERLDPTSSNSIFVEQQKILEKNMPKGYKPKSNNSVKSNNEVLIQKEELRKQLEEIEKNIAKKENDLKENDKRFEENKANIKQDLKKDLAVIRQNPFKRIKNFFSKKIEQFKSWREEKRAKANEKFINTIKNTEDVSKREMFLKDNASDISLKEQARYSAEVQEKLQEVLEKEEPQKESGKDRESE